MATARRTSTAEIAFLARELKTPVIAETFATLGDQARTEAAGPTRSTWPPSWAARSPPDRQRHPDADRRRPLPAGQDHARTSPSTTSPPPPAT